MAGIFNGIIRLYLKTRYKRVLEMKRRSPELQKEQLRSLMERSYNTEYGKLHGFSEKMSRKEFAANVPIVGYEELKPYIERTMDGEQQLLWSQNIQWFSKSSGTTDRSKFLPVSEDSYNNNHIGCGWDTMSAIYHNHPESEVFKRKNLVMGGSLQSWESNTDIQVGDVSAILLKRLPLVARPFYTPDMKTALMEDWEEKLERMAHICKDEDVSMFAGVPTWTMVLFNKILDMTGKENMQEVWPNAKFYLHGGVGFDPYREQFRKYFPNDTFKYYEIYNASEGYFSANIKPSDDGMLLFTNNDIYYEFVPVSHAHEQYPPSVPIEEVEIGVDYMLVISTASGMWRYTPGDTVRFTSKHPYKIVVSGRTKHFINVFGEEVMVGNTEKALSQTIEQIPASVTDYTVGPIFLDEKNGGHHWIIEFSERPKDIEAFADLLDTKLQGINSDYAAKRYKDIALKRLKLDAVPVGTFHKWMKERGKMGGQNKMPRLYNDRTYVDQLISLCND